jgi:hypothetical protein
MSPNASGLVTQVLAGSALVAALGGCGGEPGGIANQESASDGHSAVSTAEIDRVLASDGTVVAWSDAPGGACDGSMDAFAAEYGFDHIDAGQVFYGLVQESDVTLLRPELPVCVVFVPDVPQDIAGPVHADGSTPSTRTITTADIGFYKPTTTEFLLRMSVQTDP